MNRCDQMQPANNLKVQGFVERAFSRSTEMCPPCFSPLKYTCYIMLIPHLYMAHKIDSTLFYYVCKQHEDRDTNIFLQIFVAQL